MEKDTTESLTRGEVAFPRVVLLTKRHPLSYHIANQLAAHGYLVAIVFERGIAGTAARWRYVRGYARRFGFLKAVDFVLYELVEQFLRAADQRRAVALVPREPLPAGIPVLEVLSCNSSESRTLLAGLAPDVFVVHATGILKPETFQIASTVALNVHGGVLPEYRGHASTFWALARGDLENVGVTVHEIMPKVDTGRFFRIGRVPIGPDDDDLTLWHRAIVLGSNLVLDVLAELRHHGTLSHEAVQGAPGPHYPRRGLFAHLAWAARWRRVRAAFLHRKGHQPG